MIFEILGQNIDNLEFEPGKYLSEWLEKTIQESCAQYA